MESSIERSTMRPTTGMSTNTGSYAPKRKISYGMGGQKTSLYKPKPIDFGNLAQVGMQPVRDMSQPMPFPKFGYGSRLPIEQPIGGNNNPGGMGFWQPQPDGSFVGGDSFTGQTRPIGWNPSTNQFPDYGSKQPIQPQPIAQPQPFPPQKIGQPIGDYQQKQPTPRPFNPYEHSDSDVGNPIVPSQPKIGLPKFPRPIEEPRYFPQPIPRWDDYRKYLA